ncbi:hypothetical protein B484DRAFT_404104, partial [Ochromonadaceae sp. CCMP2298]
MNYLPAGLLKGSLRDLLGAVVNGRAPRPPLREVLAKFVCVCEALNVLHSFEPSYVHQDVKPDNIMIGDDGMPVLMDLGSVRTATRHVRTRKDELRISEEPDRRLTSTTTTPSTTTPPAPSTSLDFQAPISALELLSVHLSHHDMQRLE